ncbi:MAG: prepilin-type N-terminal cleavage/methylation domain-containing protein [Planctomycetaceae bacterium]|nr:prepilin-type N-terminal cleavage/methylation domain-containing protein [Planctomycetaceae bacterium]
MALLAPRNNRSTRRGFSLIELMVVIVIIGILMGMLFVGINSAMSAARVASVNAEIQNLGKAISDFKLQYGVEPPSFIVLYEDASYWNDPTPSEPAAITDDAERIRLRNVSKATIRSIWPNYNFTASAYINNDTDSSDTFILNGAECLVFFLGGTADPNVATQWLPTGFSADSTRPFTPGGNRVGPFAEMLPARFVDTDSDGMPEYVDGLPSQTTPLQYFSSYDGTGYRARGLDDSYGTADDETIPDGLVSEYMQANGAASGADPKATSPNASLKPQSFQIISPGADNEFGLGGVYNDDWQNQTAAQKTYFSGTRDLTTERDNITNFKGGKLQ